jgi:hypothetical protein
VGLIRVATCLTADLVRPGAVAAVCSSSDCRDKDGRAALLVRDGAWWKCTAGHISRTVAVHPADCDFPATAHRLRHFAGTAWYRVSGHDLLTTTGLLRHANVATSQIYVQTDTTRPAEVINAVTLRLVDARSTAKCPTTFAGSRRTLEEARPLSWSLGSTTCSGRCGSLARKARRAASVVASRSRTNSKNRTWSRCPSAARSSMKGVRARYCPRTTSYPAFRCASARVRETGVKPGRGGILVPMPQGVLDHVDVERQRHRPS